MAKIMATSKSMNTFGVKCLANGGGRSVTRLDQTLRWLTTFGNTAEILSFGLVAATKSSSPHRERGPVGGAMDIKTDKGIGCFVTFLA